MTLLSHGYARTVARKRVELSHLRARVRELGELRKSAEDDGRESERRWWTSFAAPQEGETVWLPVEDALRRNLPRLVVPIMPRPSALIDLHALPESRGPGLAEFIAEPMAAQLPNGVLVRWFNWRCENFESLSDRERERRAHKARVEAMRAGRPF